MRGWSGLSSRSFKIAGSFLLSASLLTGAAATAYGQAQTFNVVLDAFSIAGAPASVRAGAPITFNARNASPASDATARAQHNVVIEGPGGVVTMGTGAILTGGQSGTFTFPALEPGNYVLFCSVGNGFHRTSGMAVNFTAVAGAAALPTAGGFAVSAGLAVAGLAAGAAGVALRRRTR